jgi:hypothetical protein
MKDLIKQASKSEESELKKSDKEQIN